MLKASVLGLRETSGNLSAIAGASGILFGGSSLPSGQDTSEQDTHCWGREGGGGGESK
jgi:hypothetical protein